MSRIGPGGGTQGQGFPRVSGDEPASICAVVAGCTFSPRERG